MGHYVFFVLEILFAVAVVTWGVLTLRRMDRNKKEPDRSD